MICIGYIRNTYTHAPQHSVHQHTMSLSNDTTEVFLNLQTYRRTSRRKRWTLDTLLKEYEKVQSPEDWLLTSLCS